MCHPFDFFRFTCRLLQADMYDCLVIESRQASKGLHRSGLRLLRPGAKAPSSREIPTWKTQVLVRVTLSAILFDAEARGSVSLTQVGLGQGLRADPRTGQTSVKTR